MWVIEVSTKGLSMSETDLVQRKVRTSNDPIYPFVSKGIAKLQSIKIFHFSKSTRIAMQLSKLQMQIIREGTSQQLEIARI